MYALANIKKFVEDNRDRLGDRVNEILARAEDVSCNGVLSGSAIEIIMQDRALAQEFHDVVLRDLNHIHMGLVALRKVYGQEALVGPSR